jgi:hypothetical protein
MSIPGWVLGTFAVVMILVAEVSAGQLVMARAWTRRGAAGADVAVSHLLAGIAVAGILVSGLRVLPNGAWEAVFAVMTGWFAWCLWRESRSRGAAAVLRGDYAPHLVHSATMLYLFGALTVVPAQQGPGPPMSGMDGMSGAASGSSGGGPALQVPTLALICALLLIAFTVLDLDWQAGVGGHFHVAGRPLAAGGPALAAAAAGPASGGRAGPAAHTGRLLLSAPVMKGCQVTTGVTITFTLIIMI